MYATFFVLFVFEMAHDLPEQGRIFVTQLLLLRHIALPLREEDRK
jgi:hypothetical protein